MEWRIRDSSHGGALAPSGVGVTMPAFIVYESTRFETRRRAEAYVRERTRKR